MVHELKCTRDEMEMLLDLLECRQRALPAEIHHTDALRAKAVLRKRSRAVDRLAERIRYELEPDDRPALRNAPKAKEAVRA